MNHTATRQRPPAQLRIADGLEHLDPDTRETFQVAILGVQLRARAEWAAHHGDQATLTALAAGLDGDLYADTVRAHGIDPLGQAPHMLPEPRQLGQVGRLVAATKKSALAVVTDDGTALVAMVMTAATFASVIAALLVAAAVAS